MIVNSVIDLIGNTPIIKLDFEDSVVYLKLEWMNPGGSVKDRVAKGIILDAIKNSTLKIGDTVIEATSGNTGIGLALVCTSLGINCICVMPDSVSEERKKIIKGYGAEIILTDASLGMSESKRLAEEIAIKKGYFQTLQFENNSNTKIHYNTTAIEILEDFDNIDAFVCAVGTGGTLTGISKKLKEEYKDVYCVAVEPLSSNVLSGGNAGSHKIQGIGAGFIPVIVDTTLIDEIIEVTDEEAFATARYLHTLGVFCGISTGANVFAARAISKRLGKDKVVVTISPSNGERYLSTELFMKIK